MGEYIGLDVSMKDTAISVRRDRKRVWRGKCASDPEVIARTVRKHVSDPERIIFETGPLAVWFFHALQAEGLPAICVDARHAKAALDMAPNKTDANDADGLAHLAEVGFYREVRVKGFDSMLTRTLVAARTKLVRIKTDISNQIRGLMKTFGLVIPGGKGSRIRSERRREAGRSPRPRSHYHAAARGLAQCPSTRRRANSPVDPRCSAERTMPVAHVHPGVGVVTASAFATAIEDPANFRRSRSVGAWLGLTTRRYQSGEVDYDGHISKRGDNQVRSLLYEAALVILTRSTAQSSLRDWGLSLKERVGFKRAAVAVARKLAVIMHSMLKSGELFDRAAGAAA